MQEKEQGREPLQQKYTGLLSSLTEKWGGGEGCTALSGDLDWKKVKQYNFFFLLWEMFCPFLAIVGKITPGAQLAGNQTFQIHWLRTLHLNRFLKQLLNTVFVEIVSGKFMSLYTYMQALITCTIIHSNNFSLALLTPSKLYLFIDLSSGGDPLIKLYVLLCLYPLCTPVLSLYWCDLGMSKPSPFFVCKERRVHQCHCIACSALTSLLTYPHCGKFNQKRGTLRVSCAIWCLMRTSLWIFRRAFEIYIMKSACHDKRWLMQSIWTKKNWHVKGKRGDNTIYMSFQIQALFPWEGHCTCLSMALRLGCPERHEEGRGPESHFPGKNWAMPRGKAVVLQWAKESVSGEKGETKWTSLETGRFGGAAFKGQESRQLGKKHV